MTTKLDSLIHGYSYLSLTQCRRIARSTYLMLQLRTQLNVKWQTIALYVTFRDCKSYAVLLLNCISFNIRGSAHTAN